MDIIEAMAEAILRFEGWFPAGTPGFPQGSRAWRKRNPGNLRPRPGEAADSGGYAIHPSLDVGWIKLKLRIGEYFGGAFGLSDKSTLVDFFNVYAPADDSNAPALYATKVASWITSYTGHQIGANTTIGELKALH